MAGNRAEAAAGVPVAIARISSSKTSSFRK
jgi:hypothetical protein